MHPAIAAFPRDQYYEEKLLDGKLAAAFPPINSFPWPQPSKPVCMISHEGQEEKTKSSYESSIEFKLVTQIVSRVVSELGGAGIGVITAYRLQKDKLSEFCTANSVEIGSIDSFQGREKDLIIVSTVRGNTSGDVGFLADARRINVALTRARRGLIVICNASTLEKDVRSWGLWIRWCREHKLNIDLTSDNLSDVLDG